MIDYFGEKIRLKFSWSCLKQPNISYTHGTVVTIYIVYELGASGPYDSDPTLKNCLFGAVTLTKNADINKYGYCDYGIKCDRRLSFSFPVGGYIQSVLTVRADMSLSAHFDNKEKDILVLGKGAVQGLAHTLIAEMYSLILQ